MQIYLYGPIYQGVKLTFNSTKGRGKTVQGIAVDVVDTSGIVVLRDQENFQHCVDAKYIDVLDHTNRGIHYSKVKK